MEGLFGLALRQGTGVVESLLHLVGLDWTVPDLGTLGRRQKSLAVTIRYRGSLGPQNLLTGATVIGRSAQSTLPVPRPKRSESLSSSILIRRIWARPLG